MFYLFETKQKKYTNKSLNKVTLRFVLKLWEAHESKSNNMLLIIDSYCNRERER